MAKQDLAGIWLKENDKSHDISCPSRNFKVGFKRNAPFLQCELDRIVFEQLRANEQSGKRSGKMRRAGAVTDAHGLNGIDFLNAHVSFDGLACLLLPYADLRKPSSVRVNGRDCIAARTMCKMAHGKPKSDELVARHLCGRGHWSCVNPSHLRWGTHAQNAHDTSLHHRLPKFQPDIDRALVSLIQQDNRHYNILAIHYNVASAVVKSIQSGAHFIKHDVGTR